MVTNKAWYSGVLGHIGLVQIDTVIPETGHQKNYVGGVLGASENGDANTVAEYGAPFQVPDWIVRDVLQDFYKAVCKRAEQTIASGGRLEGAHYAAMRHVLSGMGVNVND